MRDERKALKIECVFAISELKVGFIELWEFLWAALVAPFKVSIEFATGKGRWAVRHTVDPDTQLSSLGIDSLPISKWLRTYGVGGSTYYRLFGTLFSVNSVFFALYLIFRMINYLSTAR
jgi:hypothetical protein